MTPRSKSLSMSARGILACSSISPDERRGSRDPRTRRRCRWNSAFVFGQRRQRATLPQLGVLSCHGRNVSTARVRLSDRSGGLAAVSPAEAGRHGRWGGAKIGHRPDRSRPLAVAAAISSAEARRVAAARSRPPAQQPASSNRRGAATPAATADQPTQHSRRSSAAASTSSAST